MYNLGPLKSQKTEVLSSCADGYQVANLSIPNVLVFGSILMTMTMANLLHAARCGKIF